MIISDRNPPMKIIGLALIYLLITFSGCLSITAWAATESLDMETVRNFLFVISLLQIITFPILVIYNNKYLR